MSKKKFILSILLIFLLHCSVYHRLCHGRAHHKSDHHTKHGRVHHVKQHRKPNPKQLTINMTQTYNSEKQFMKWVNFVGSLKHTLFKTAKNKLFPSYTLTVSKNAVTGDFTTIQDAIDSLPAINLVRVIIKVKAGTYS